MRVRLKPDGTARLPRHPILVCVFGGLYVPVFRQCPGCLSVRSDVPQGGRCKRCLSLPHENGDAETTARGA